MITKAEAEAAKKSLPELAPLKEEQVTAPYFVEHVKKLLIDEYGVEKVFTGGLRVHTTLNLRAQGYAEKAIASELYRNKDPQAALASINPKNGHIVALVGGRDFKHVKYNLATQGKRQPGSSFKMFVLVTALKQGISPNDTFNSSSPQTIRTTNDPNIPPWIVHNCEGKGYGMMTLREASVHSVNCVYANVTMKVGAAKVVETAKQMGIKTHLDAYPSIGIGGLTVGVSPLEMASAYGTLANNGIHIEPTPIIKITDASGKVIKEVTPQGKQVISSQVAYQATDILQGTIQRGTATRANIGRPAAGKTGTNQLYRDAWFVGYTPNLVTAVWMGHPEAQISMYNVHGSRGFGGIIPATIWRKFMKPTLSKTPISYFTKPGAPAPKAGKSSAKSNTSNLRTYKKRSYSNSDSYSRQRLNRSRQEEYRQNNQQGQGQYPRQSERQYRAQPSRPSPPTTSYRPPTSTKPPTTGNGNDQQNNNNTNPGNNNSGSGNQSPGSGQNPGQNSD